MSRVGDWMQTVTGRTFWPLDPRAEDVHPYDIAHALSNLCRFNGHTKRFYSVAEHSLYVSQVIDPEHALWGLLHDASEAYLGDVIRPIKPFIAQYKVREERVMAAVAGFFGLPPEPHEIVKRADNQVLAAEGQQVMTTDRTPEWNLAETPADIQIKFYAPAVARDLFLVRLQELLEKRIQK